MSNQVTIKVTLSNAEADRLRARATKQGKPMAKVVHTALIGYLGILDKLDAPEFDLFQDKMGSKP